MEPEKKPGKWRRRLKRALKVLLVVAVVLVLLHGLWNLVAGRRLEEQLQAMRQAGEPVTLAELYPELPYPEAENAAHVYRAAFELMTGLKLYPKANPFLSSSLLIPSLSEEDVAELRRFLDEYRLPIDLGRRAAHMAHCRFLPQFDAASGSPMLEEWAAMRNLAKLLLLDSLLKLHDGDADGALRGCTTAFLMARSLEGNPELRAFFGRLLIHRPILQTAEVILNQADPSPEVCRELLVAVREAEANLRPGLRKAYEAERVVAISFTEAMFGGEPVLPKRPSAVALPLPRKHVSYWKRPLQRTLLAAVIQSHTELLALNEAPYPQARPAMDEVMAARGREMYRNPVKVMAHALSDLRFPGWFRKSVDFLARDFSDLYLLSGSFVVANKEDVTVLESHHALAQVALALKLYKAERGHYPDSLDALSPAFLDEVPADPCTGSSLNFRREGDGFLLYSVGPNGKDDGGRTRMWEDSRKVNPGTDDVAWRGSR